MNLLSGKSNLLIKVIPAGEFFHLTDKYFRNFLTDPISSSVIPT